LSRESDKWVFFDFCDIIEKILIFMRYIRGVTIFILCFGVIFSPTLSFGAMTGGGYEIYGDTFSASEDSLTSSSGYSLHGTAGEFFAQDATGGGYTLRGGFQAMEKGILILDFTTNTISLGTLSLTQVVSTTVSTTISTDSLTGYSLSFDEDGNLRDGANDINDVLDGSVTAGSEEYGIRTIGGGGVLVVDTAIADGLEVASSVGPENDEETGIKFSAGLAGSSRAGSYSHVITATLTANP
jgi:hypothetical protein